jgi:WD40 repeat protein
MIAENPLTSIDVMADGATVAVGSTRGIIYIYDLRHGNAPMKIINAHKSSVQCLKFQHGISVSKNKQCIFLDNTKIIQVAVILRAIFFMFSAHNPFFFNIFIFCEC